MSSIVLFVPTFPKSTSQKSKARGNRKTLKTTKMIPKSNFRNLNLDIEKL